MRRGTGKAERGRERGRGHVSSIYFIDLRQEACWKQPSNHPLDPERVRERKEEEREREKIRQKEHSCVKDVVVVVAVAVVSSQIRKNFLNDVSVLGELETN